MKITNLSLLLLLVISLSSCIKENEIVNKKFAQIEKVKVTPSDEGLIFSARMLSEGIQPVIEYGFVCYVWDQENLVTVSFPGAPPREFSYTFTGGLPQNNVYKAAAYIKTPEYTIYSADTEFNCPPEQEPVITGFSPKRGTTGTKVTIYGKYFFWNPEATKVFFGQCEAKVLKATSDSLVVEIGEGNRDGLFEISVITNTHFATMSEEPFEVWFPWSIKLNGLDYTDEDAVIYDSLLFIFKNDKTLMYNINTGHSYRLPAFPGYDRTEAATFVYDGNIYYGLGQVLGEGYYTDLWALDLTNYSWSKKSDYPGTPGILRNPFVIGNKVYMGPGEIPTTLNEPDQYMYDFYEYDPASDTWTRKKDFPVKAGSVGFQFSAYGKGYMSAWAKRDIYEYNPVTDEWKYITRYKGQALVDLAGFAMNGKIYLGLGNGLPGYPDRFYYDMWEYNPESNEWNESIDFDADHYLKVEETFPSGYILFNKTLYKFNPAKE